MRIIETLKEKNKKQIDLANYLGISKSTMSLYASGKREPDIATLIRIADYFGVSVDYLIGHETAADRSVSPAPANVVYVNDKKVALKDDALKIEFNGISVEIKNKEES